MQLHLGEFGPPRISGRTLLILCSYRGGVSKCEPWRASAKLPRGVARILNLTTLLPLRAHIATLRDHYANPRSSAAQIELAKAALATGRPDAVRLIVDEPLASQIASPPSIDVETQDTTILARTVPPLEGVNTVVLVYPDALGLTFGRLERQLKSSGADNIVVVTGRRRLFPLTEAARRALRWRRMLASTRLVELAAVVAVIPIAAVLAVYDRLRGRA
jgi:hypothetical protein